MYSDGISPLIFYLSKNIISTVYKYSIICKYKTFRINLCVKSKSIHSAEIWITYMIIIEALMLQQENHVKPHYVLSLLHP